jgi:transposase
MKELAHRRHDLSDEMWSRIKDLLPGQKGCVGRPCKDNRLFINAVFWVLRTGAPWRDLPPDYGKWNTHYMRFRRWATK